MKNAGIAFVPQPELLQHLRDLGIECTDGAADLDDTSNHDDRVLFGYVVHDKGANSDSTPFFVSKRAYARRSFSGFLEGIPKTLSPDDFRLDLVCFLAEGYFYPVIRYTVASGFEMMPRNLEVKENA